MRRCRSWTKSSTEAWQRAGRPAVWERSILTVLRLALYEMAYEEGIPERVAINEAVEIARKYGGNESPSFVNGVLAKLVTEKQ